jgi:ABC-type branched-subunit amino acid transport system ATPase component/ABC-type branched-subunit amino acid transport system permease subunit
MSRIGALRVLAPSLFVFALSIAGLLLGSYWQYVLALSISAAVIGTALAMIVSYARCITIATGAMLAIGAYGAALPVVRLDVPFLVALLFAMVLGGLAGLILAVPGVRFRSHNLAMVTFVFQAVVIIVLRQSKGLTGGAEGLPIPAPVVFGFRFSSDADFLLLCGFLSALVILPLVVLLEGALGKNLRAVAANESAARAFGINVNRHLIAAFVWSSAVIACAGAIMAPRYRIIDPDSYGILASILALAYPIVGGMGSLWGGLVGGAVLRALPEVLRPLADYLELMFCILVVATIIFFPGGFGSFVTQTFRRKPVKLETPAGSEPRRAVYDFISDMNILGRRDIRPPRGHSRSTPVLCISEVTKSYGALRAVSHVSFDVTAHTIHGLMGPNGAGKTTLFNIVSGLDASDEGQVLFDGKLLDDVPVEFRIKLGMSRTFQHAAVFDKLSCVDNVLIGLGLNDIWQASVRSIHMAIHSQRASTERRAAMAALDAVGLAHRARDGAGSLSLGDQRRLEIARAIVSCPRIILLDEPVSGVSVEEAAGLRELLLRINRELGTGMVVIEHNISFLVSLCNRISVMSDGRIIADGDPDVVVDDALVRRAYFGEREIPA